MRKDTAKHTILSWKAPEFHYHKKGAWWFPIQALVTLGLVAYFILTNQFLVAIIVVLGSIIIYRLAHAEPEVLPVDFSPTGLKYKSRYWDFRDLKTFWIVESGEHHRLHLLSTERLAVPISIALSKDDVAKTRDFLSHYLPETHQQTEDLADRLLRWLRI